MRKLIFSFLLAANFSYGASTQVVPSYWRSTAGTLYGSCDVNGQYTFGQASGTRTHAVNGNLNLTGGLQIDNTLGTTNYITGNTAVPLILKNAGSDSSGIKIFNDNSSNATIMNHYSGALNLGVNETVYLIISSAGQATIGASGGSLSHVVNGGLNVSQSVNNGQKVQISNGSSGSSAEAYLQMASDTVNSYVEQFSSGYSGTGYAQANGMAVYAGGAAGLSIAAGNASGPIRFYSGGSTSSQLNGQVSTAGAWTLGATSATPTHSINTATSASASAGSSGAVPAQVQGYITININGTARKIPYFAN